MQLLDNAGRPMTWLQLHEKLAAWRAREEQNELVRYTSNCAQNTHSKCKGVKATKETCTCWCHQSAA